MDWYQAAFAAAEQSERALLLSDEQGNVCLVNRSFERLVGRTRAELTGTSIESIFRRADQTSDSKDGCLQAMMQRSAGPLQCLVTTLLGGDQLMSIEVKRWGQEGTGGVMVTVQGVISRRGRVVSDIDYEIEKSPEQFGRLKNVCLMGREYHADELGGRRCYELFWQRTSPCQDCPALRASAEGEETTLARLSVGEGENYEILTARIDDRGSLTISMRVLKSTSMRRAFSAKLRELAREAGLSEREREVLDCLIGGYSLEEIAKLMQISTRTVRFHQTNVLEKLGADSRADLWRLLV